MNITTTNTTATAASDIATSGPLKWTVNEICEANFMFPLPDYETAEEVEQDEDQSFCQVITEMLKPCQPLNNFERVGMAASVQSGNRLRVLFHAVQVVERHAIAANETQSTELPDEEVRGSQEGRGYQTEQSSLGDQSLDSLDNQIPSQEESNKQVLLSK